jgi:hypothetical protein
MQPYQYQLGGITFGRDTNIPVSKVDIQPYNVTNQDFQIDRTDENRFGIDTLVPAPIIFTMAVQENYILPQFRNVLPAGIDPDDLFAMRGTVLAQLAKTWKSKEVRSFWGAVVPLLYCTREGEVLRIYGRPGKFQYIPRTSDRTIWIDVQAEFRRGDTFAHSNVEYYVGEPDSPYTGNMPPGIAPVTAVRGPGDGDSWIRALIQGPATHPIINYGGNTIELDLTVNAGVTLEISSYPWARRVVDSNGINWRAKVIGDTKYLDQIVFPAETEMDISWSCTGSNSDTGLYWMWREAYNVI